MDLYSIFELDFFTSCLLVIYILIFIFAYAYFLNVENLLTINSFILIIISFFTPLLFFLTNQLLHLKSIPPDTKLYANIIKEYSTYYNTNSFGVTGFSIINFIPFKLCFGKPAVFIIFNIFYYNIAVLFIFKAYNLFINIFEGKKLISFQILLLLSTIYPVALIHNASILREALMLCFFSINLYYAGLIYNYKKIKIFNIIIVFLLLFIIRPITGVCIFFVYFLIFALKKNLVTVNNIIKFGILSIFSLFVVNKIISSLYTINFSIEWIADFRNKHNIQYGDEAYQSLDWSNSLYYLKNLILLVSQYIFSPLPILVQKEITFNKMIPLFDTIFIILFLLAPIIFFIRENNKKWMLFFLIMIIFPAILESNISGAYRHRMNAIFMLLPVAASMYAHLKIVYRSK